MNYEGAVYRPPSEARSFILQATIGCSHNKCTFCSMYKAKKFRIRNLDEIKQDISKAKAQYGSVRRIFIADGDALIMPTADLLEILNYISFTFPECERVGIYASPRSILAKRISELNELQAAGLGIVYLGIESGNPEILEKIEKGATREDLMAAGKRIMETALELSVTIISGIGGPALSEHHAIDSATLINEIGPNYVGILTLMVEEGTPLIEEIRSGNFALLSPKEVLKEILVFLEHTNLKEPTVFRSNHASNYLPLGGILPNDKIRLIKEIKGALLDDSHLVKESWRRL